MDQVPVQVCDQHNCVEAKFSQHLPTRAAGGSTVLRHNSNGLKGQLTLRDGFENRHPLSADRQRIDGILDVDTIKNLARIRQEGCAYTVM